MYLLDTNTISYLQRGNTSIAHHIATKDSDEITTCSHVIAELYFGATIKKDNSKKLISYYDYIFSQIQVFSFDDDSAKVFALKKSELRKKGCIIEDFDLLIASVAISNSLILVTNNTKHFDRISDLQVVDWMKPD